LPEHDDGDEDAIMYVNVQYDDYVNDHDHLMDENMHRKEDMALSEDKVDFLDNQIQMSPMTVVELLDCLHPCLDFVSSILFFCFET
jgi:hypothetical protein